MYVQRYIIADEPFALRGPAASKELLVSADGDDLVIRDQAELLFLFLGDAQGCTAGLYRFKPPAGLDSAQWFDHQSKAKQ